MNAEAEVCFDISAAFVQASVEKCINQNKASATKNIVLLPTISTIVATPPAKKKKLDKLEETPKTSLVKCEYFYSKVIII